MFRTVPNYYKNLVYENQIKPISSSFYFSTFSNHFICMTITMQLPVAQFSIEQTIAALCMTKHCAPANMLSLCTCHKRTLPITLPRNELLCQLFGGLRYQWISYKMKVWHPWQLKKSKSWGLFRSYQLNSTANLAHLPRKLCKMGWIGSAV